MFCEIVGAEFLREDPRFATIADRRENLQELTAQIDAILETRSTEEWMRILGGKVPFAPVLNIAEALDNPYVESIGMLETVEHPKLSDGLRTLASPFKVNGVRVRSSRAPDLGEHNSELLK
tara:strand:+ start:136 stop:498 length:363 start_codon:yes stop_codon:yes gene_type:complete